MRDLLLQLISGTQGKGPSSTRLVYLMNGMAAVCCASVMTVGGIVVYCAVRKADPVYWSAVAALWTATLGFGAKTKKEQQKASAEIALASHHNPVAAQAPAFGD
jgi:uncharacterized membrane protein